MKNYVRWTVRRPAIMLWIATPILLLLTAIAISPQPPLVFDASTHSMEPKSSDAGYALHTIMAQDANALGAGIGDRAHEGCAAAARLLAEDRAALGGTAGGGKIKSFSTPAALALSPAARCKPIAQKLGAIDFAGHASGAGSRDRERRIQRRNLRLRR